MRKSLIFSTILTTTAILGTQTLVGQNTPYWSLSGNSNTSIYSQLGTLNAVPLKLSTNNTIRIYINASGQVGIGTTAPAQRLSVAGNTYVSGNLGVGAPNPTQKLVIAGNAYVTDKVGIGTTDFSQSKLIVNSSHYESPLSLQVDGVTRLYVGRTGGLSIGSGSMPPSNGLYVAGNIGIGTRTPAQKLHVEGNAYISGNIYNSGDTYVSAKLGIGTTKPSYKLEAQGGSVTAIAGFSSSTAVYGKGGAIGVYGWGATYGVYAGSADGYGAYLYSGSGTGLYAATGRGDKNYAGVFQGNVHATGLYTSSDRELKQNIEEVDEAMSVINQLKPRHYEFRQDGRYAVLNLPQGKHYGLIAQELEEVLPSLVKEVPLPIMEPPAEPMAGDEKTPVETTATKERGEETISVKAVNYIELIPILVKALQEQDGKIEQQQQQINELKDIVSRLSKGEHISTTLSSAELLQNVPNPVRGSTSISYRLPDGASRAKLVVTDVLGRTIKTLELTRSGVVNFDASTLSSGVYSYSLVVNNKVLQTRKMTVKK